MNVLDAKITKFLGKPVYRKTSKFEYFYRKCLIDCCGKEFEYTVMANDFVSILNYKIGDVVKV